MSVNFGVISERESVHTHRVIDLCGYLLARVLKPMFERERVNWGAQAARFFVPEFTGTSFQPVGVILFNPPPMFAGEIGEMEEGIRAALRKIGVRSGPFVRERKPGGKLCVRIPITENPTAADAPPEVNMSRTAANLVLRDLLGFAPSAGRYTCPVDDLLARISAVTEKEVIAKSMRPTADPSVPGRVRQVSSPMVVKRIHRCLNELSQYAWWAKRHGFEKLGTA